MPALTVENLVAWVLQTTGIIVSAAVLARLVRVDTAGLGVFRHGRVRCGDVLRILLCVDPHPERLFDDVPYLAAVLGGPYSHGAIELVIRECNGHLHPAILPSRYPDI